MYVKSDGKTFVETDYTGQLRLFKNKTLKVHVNFKKTNQCTVQHSFINPFIHFICKLVKDNRSLLYDMPFFFE